MAKRLLFFILSCSEIQLINSEWYFVYLFIYSTLSHTMAYVKNIWNYWYSPHSHTYLIQFVWHLCACKYARKWQLCHVASPLPCRAVATSNVDKVNVWLVRKKKRMIERTDFDGKLVSQNTWLGLNECHCHSVTSFCVCFSSTI